MDCHEALKFYEKDLYRLVDLNSHHAVGNSRCHSIVKTPEFKYRGKFFSSDRFLSEKYLLNFKRGRQNTAFTFGVNQYQQQRVYDSALLRRLKNKTSANIQLPAPDNTSVSLSEAVRSRRSIRAFQSEHVSIKELSTILFHAQGITGQEKSSVSSPPPLDSGIDTIFLRAIPSAGFFYPVDLYLYCKNTHDLATGFYHYIPEGHSLQLIDHPPEEIEFDILASVPNIDTKNANVMIFYVYRLYVNSRKYGDSGLAFAFIEAGEIAQNIQLICTAIQRGACDLGEYFKQKIESILKIDGLSEHVIHATIIG